MSVASGAARNGGENFTAKCLLLKHYRGGPQRHPNFDVPMDRWDPEQIEPR
ncbi:hypothetical protein [Haloglycomyces albus]|uniref:hypothetical protein n=1 Tax=Haloglycomyces albus TaxID=526067 RepID=UPI0004BAC343|nr:hypothetical protein [Haloglycomyces albus]